MAVDNIRIKETHVTIEKLVECVEDHSSQKDIDLVMRAYVFAENHYAHLDHPTGISYIQYVINIAKYLTELGSVPSVIAAAMICPPSPFKQKILGDLRKDFKDEDELLELVEEVLQISHLEEDVWPSVQAQDESRERKEILHRMFLLTIDETKSENQERGSLAAISFQKKEKQVENLIRMFLAEVTDIRALIIKLVDRLYLIKYIKDLLPSRQQAMNYKLLAKITLEIYAPLADRLGMWRLKSGLEDMSFRLLEPDKYKEVVWYLAAKKQEREKVINDIIPIVQAQLKEFKIKAEVSGRAKHIYSIYKKWKLNN